MIRVEKTNASDPVFVKLVADLDRFLAVTDGEDHAFYDQFNQLDDIKYAIVTYIDDQPIGCGAIKRYDSDSFEVKRMYTAETHRGNGYASILLDNLEKWAIELGAQMCILETGVRQPAAIRLYQKNGYERIHNYGQYTDVEDSVCFRKVLSTE
jgi:GNAT superfamily N-acetyltransferase